SPTVATLLSSSSITVGGTIHDSSTLTGATSDAGGTVKYRYYSVLADCQAGTFATTGGTSAGDKTVTNGVVRTPTTPPSTPPAPTTGGPSTRATATTTPPPAPARTRRSWSARPHRP